MPDNRRDILRIALPALVTNITVPLLGLCDSAIAGHMGGAEYIGAIAVGGMCFNILYWLLGVLRMSSSALTAQTLGAGGTNDDMLAVLCRSVMTATALSMLIVLLQVPFFRLCMLILQPSAAVAELAATYYYICLPACPAVLCQFAITGWILGKQNARYTLYIAVSQNIINILFSLMLVVVCGMKVAGVAWGTMVAQWVGLMISCYFARLMMPRGTTLRHIADIARGTLRGGMEQWTRMLSVNAYLFLRTLCMVAVTVFFTAAGARQSDVILALNALLMQFFMFFSYFTDSLAYAAEALCGKYAGSADMANMRDVVRRLMRMGLGLTAVFTLLYALWGNDILRLLTSDEAVREAAEPYWIFVMLIPICGYAAFIWDGIMVGLTHTRFLLAATASAALVFALVYTLHPFVDTNATLWAAFLAYLATRSLTQTLMERHTL